MIIDLGKARDERRAISLQQWSYFVRIDQSSEGLESGTILDLGSELSSAQLADVADDLRKLSHYVMMQAIEAGLAEGRKVIASVDMFADGRVTVWDCKELETDEQRVWFDGQLDAAKELVRQS